MWAQSDSGQSGKTSDANTLTGCLRRHDDQYILTEDDGTAHRLSGAAKKLGHQLEREIEVTGKPGTISEDFTSAGGASTVIEREVFQVKTVKRVADSCR